MNLRLHGSDTVTLWRRMDWLCPDRADINPRYKRLSRGHPGKGGMSHAILDPFGGLEFYPQSYPRLSCLPFDGSTYRF